MASQVDAALGALHAQGRAAWGDVDLDIATFSRLAARRIGNIGIDDIRAGELYLAIACTMQIPRAIIAFDGHYVRGLAALLTRRGHEPAIAADVVQELRIRFLVGEPGRPPRIAMYDGRRSLAGWLRLAAVRLAMNASRRHCRELPSERLEVTAADRDPESRLLHGRLRVEFAAALREAFEALTPRQRDLLRDQVLDELGIDHIAARHGVHRATAARWLAGAIDALRGGVRRILRAQLRLTTGELEGVMQSLHGTIELSPGLLFARVS